MSYIRIQMYIILHLKVENLHKTTIFRLLKDRSHGVPSWCDQLLQEMYHNGSILVVPYKDKGNYYPGGVCKDSAVLPPKKFVRNRINSLPNDSLTIKRQQVVDQVKLDK